MLRIDSWARMSADSTVLLSVCRAITFGVGVMTRGGAGETHLGRQVVDAVLPSVVQISSSNYNASAGTASMLMA